MKTIQMLTILGSLLALSAWSLAQTNPPKAAPKTASKVSTAQSAQFGDFKMTVGGMGKFYAKFKSKSGEKEWHIDGNPITLVSTRLDLQGKTLVAFLVTVKGESFIKSAILTEKVRIVSRQEGEKHIITCDKATLESVSVKGKKTVNLYGNVHDESQGVFGNVVLTAQTGRVEIEGDVTEVNLDNPTAEGNLVSTPNNPKTPKKDKK
jgi:hypothetical protein